MATTSWQMEMKWPTIPVFRSASPAKLAQNIALHAQISNSWQSPSHDRTVLNAPRTSSGIELLGQFNVLLGSIIPCSNSMDNASHAKLMQDAPFPSGSACVNCHENGCAQICLERTYPKFKCSAMFPLFNRMPCLWSHHCVQCEDPTSSMPSRSFLRQWGLPMQLWSRI